MVVSDIYILGQYLNPFESSAEFKQFDFQITYNRFKVLAIF